MTFLPMYFAPRDYTTILLKIPDRDYLTRGRWASGGWAARTNMKFIDLAFNETHQPTGWLPETEDNLRLAVRPVQTQRFADWPKGVYREISDAWPSGAKSVPPESEKCV